MVKEMKKELTKRGLQLTVRFVIQPDQQNIYDEFCKQVLEAQDGIVKISLLLLEFDVLTYIDKTDSV